MNRKGKKQFLETAMKLSFIKIALFVCSTPAFSKVARSQEVLQKKVNLTIQHVGLREALRKIEVEADVKFTYVSNILSPDDKISISSPDLRLHQVLEQLLTPYQIQYEAVGNQIILKKLNIDNVEKTAQQTVTGKIVDEKGKPVIGATVRTKSAPSNGTSSNNTGEFSIQATQRDILIVSIIGYQTQEIPVSGAVMNITLSPASNVLEDVVVVGYGTQKKSTLTGSISTVSGKTLEQIPTSNLTNAIAGNLPGVIATNPNGIPGSGSNLQIRGLSTLNNNAALVVIDGVVRPDGFGNLDPNEIESLSVLKDAAAASVYGARAANGVFLITTKRGKSGKPSITYSGMMGIQNPTNYPELMSAYQFASVRNKALLNQGYNPTNPAHSGFFYTDNELTDFQSRGNKNVWYDATFKKNAIQSDHNVAISGGTEDIKYFASVGTMDQDGMYDNINFKRYNFRSNLDARVNKNLVVKLGLEGRQENKDNPGYDAGSIFAYVLRQNPTFKIYNPDGSYFNTNGEHPVAMYESTGYNNERWNVFQGSLSFDHDLSFVTEGLSLNGMMSIYKDRLFQKTFFTPYTMYDMDENNNVTGTKVVGVQTSLNQQYRENDQQTYNLALNYGRSFGDHAVKGLLVYEEYRSNGNEFNAYRQQFLSNSKDEFFASGTENQNIGGRGFITDARRSVVGRINYAFQDKYLLEGVFRYDGSYRFPANKRWGFFPAVSAGWVISKEAFFANTEALDFISNLKLRASTGLVGNDRVPAFQFLDNYTITTGAGPIIDGSAVPYISYGVYPNQQITWEKQRSTNIGLDASFLNAKIDWTFEYFMRNTYDILWRRIRSVPGTFGRDLPSENYAKMNNRGWETSIGYHENIGQVKMDLNFNISHVTNEIIEIDDPNNGLDYQRQKGKSYNFRSGYEADGLFRSQSEADAWYGGKQFGQSSKAGDIKYKDLNGNGVIDIQDQKVLSEYNNDPRMVYGLGGNLRWKGFDFSFLFQGTAMRNMMLEGTARVMYSGGGASGNFAYLADSWTPENTDAAYPLAWVDARTINNRNSSFWLKDAGYIRLKSVNIGHSFNSTWLNKRGIDRLRVYVSGYNLLTWSQLKEFDPEVSATNGAYYPQQRNFNLGINITL